MIKSIDGLNMPPSIDATPELKNRDVQAQTVSGRLVVELDPQPKWEIPIAYEASALTIDFQAQFYAKCFSMRSTPASVTFISPYDGSETTVTALCVEIPAPNPIGIAWARKSPIAYRNTRAVFREV